MNVSDSCSVAVTMKNEELDSLLTRDGTLDYKGQPAEKSKTGTMSVSPYIFVAEFAERTAGFGVAINIITYLVKQKHFHLADAANMTTNFIGTSFLLTLLGGFLADTYLGRFWTILVFQFVQLMGLFVMIINSSLNQFKCFDTLQAKCKPAHGADVTLIYLGLYLVALGTGGIKSSVSSFGADQFEKEDPKEARQMPHYFNYFYLSVMLGALLAGSFIVYIQDRSWSWGFGALAIIMCVSIVTFCIARRSYRYKIPQGSPLTALSKVFVAAVRNRNLPRPIDIRGFCNEERKGALLKVAQTKNMRWVDKAAIMTDKTSSTIDRTRRIATITEVEDFKMVMRLLPILATTWFFWTVQAQFHTFTITQASTMNRSLGPNFTVPPASVGVLQTVTILLGIAVYDRVFLPIARRFTGNPRGITTLQRIGLALVTPIFTMTCAALVERRRLQEVHHLNWELRALEPMKSFSMFWIAPQFLIMGIGEAFMLPGQLDFFYSESPENMQSMGSSLYLCTIAIGNFASSAMVSAVNSVSSSSAQGPWIPDNVNVARLDSYYWLLAVISAINLILFLIVSKFHIYKTTYIYSSPTIGALDEGQDIDQPSKVYTSTSRREDRVSSSGTGDA